MVTETHVHVAIIVKISIIPLQEHSPEGCMVYYFRKATEKPNALLLTYFPSDFTPLIPLF